MGTTSRMISRSLLSWLLAPGSWLLLLASGSCLLPACSLFDDTKLKQQRAEIARLKEESQQLQREAEALQQQQQKETKERETCNRAFSAFEAARKAGDTETAISRYREGINLCPSDDVAHNELGELYLRLGRKAEAGKSGRLKEKPVYLTADLPH